MSICTYGFVAVRREPAETSEMTTQILFGETYEVIEEQDTWLKVRLDYDGYEGWIDAKLHRNIFGPEVDSWRRGKKWIVPGPFAHIIREGERSPMIIPGGSEIYFNSDGLSNFTIGDRSYTLTGNHNPNRPTGTIEEIAMTFYSAPYLWGGRSFYGIDCSGFAQVVFKIAGKRIPRDASQQVNEGTVVNFVEEAHAGDLAFFDKGDGRITHVGICFGRGEIIHASGSVRIDRLDHQGIYSTRSNKYTHSLRTIKRIE